MSLKEKEEKIAELEKKLAVIKNDREIDSTKIIRKRHIHIFVHMIVFILQESLNVLIFMSLLIMCLMIS